MSSAANCCTTICAEASALLELSTALAGLFLRSTGRSRCATTDAKLGSWFELSTAIGAEPHFFKRKRSAVSDQELEDAKQAMRLHESLLSEDERQEVRERERENVRAHPFRPEWGARPPPDVALNVKEQRQKAVCLARSSPFETF